MVRLRRFIERHLPIMAVAVAAMPSSTMAADAADATQRYGFVSAIVGALILAAVGGAVIAIAIRGRVAPFGAWRSASEAERRLRDFAAAGADWFWELDDQLRFVAIETAPHVERAPLDASAQDRLWRDTSFGEVASHGLGELEAKLGRRESFRDIVLVHKGKSDELRYAFVSASPRFDVNGRFLGYRGAGRDVTAALQREETLRVERRRAEEASEAKTAFIATLSHEMRSPLNAIIGFAEVMGRQVLGPLGSPRYLAYAQDIATAGQHMLSLVNDIIDMSKLETGQHVLNEVEFDLEDVIAESVSLIRGRAERDRHPIELRLEAWPRLKADERALRQILVNLLTNALKFSNQGGRVEIETAIVEGDSNNLHIRVRDHGIGIDDADLARLGKPFMQLKPGRDLGEGSGLGLTITRYLAELHGGRIEITSTLGKGTTATFVLPASRIVIRDTLAHRRKEATR